MDYVNHINKFEDAQAIQAALDAGTLANPYVAMTSAGTLDFNSLQPTPPAPATMGVWSENTNSFTILENDYQTYWYDPAVYIGTFNGVYFVEGEDPSEVQPINMDLYLYYNGQLNFTLRDKNDPYRFDTTTGSFQVGVATSDCFEYTYIDPAESSGNINVDWDGVDTFTFWNNYGTLSVTKVNPPYPAPAPATMGTWTYDSQMAMYILQITDDSDQYWTNPIYVGKMNGVYFDGDQADFDVYLSKDVQESSTTWLLLLDAGGAVSSNPDCAFDPETSYMWPTGLQIVDGSVETEIAVDYDGANTFVFGDGGPETPLSMTTVNPPYPEAGE